MALVQQVKNAQADVTSMDVSLSGVVAGHVLILAISKWEDAWSPTCSGGGATWTKRQNHYSSGADQRQGVDIFEGVGTTGGSVTVTISNGVSADISANLSEWDDLLASGAYDTGAAAGGTGSQPESGPTDPLSQADNLIISVESHVGGTTSAPRSGDGFAELIGEDDSSTLSTLGVAYKYVSATTAVNGRWDTDASEAWSAAVAAFKVAPRPQIDSVTPDEFADGASVVIAGDSFGDAQGDGEVLVSPVDDPAGETAVSAAYFDGASGGANPTTSTTITIPADLPSTCVLCLHFTSRDHTAGTGQPTVSDNNGGAAWTQREFSTDRKSQWWWKRYEAGLASKTITISGAVGSLSARLVVIDDAYETGDPFTDFVAEANASGNESHAAITPTHAGSAVVFAVYNYANDNAVTGVTAATTGAPGQSTGHLSTGGSDCGTHVAVWDAHPASSSGAITWAQTNGTTYSHAYAVRPRTPAGAPVVQTVTAWADDEITITAVQDTLALGSAFLFVFDDDGMVNASGFPVTLTEASEPEALSVRSATSTRTAAAIDTRVAAAAASRTATRSTVAATTTVGLSPRSASSTRTAAALTPAVVSLAARSATSTRTAAQAAVTVRASVVSSTATRTAAAVRATVGLAARSASATRTAASLTAATVRLAARSSTLTWTAVLATVGSGLTVTSSTPTRTAVVVAVPVALSASSRSSTRTAVALTIATPLSASSRTSTRTATALTIAPSALAVQSATSTRSSVALTVEAIASLAVVSSTSTRTALDLTVAPVALAADSRTGTRTAAAADVPVRLAARSGTATRTAATASAAVVGLSARSATSTRTSVAARIVADVAVDSRTATRTSASLTTPAVALPIASRTDTRSAVTLTVLQLTIPVDQITQITVPAEDRTIMVSAEDRTVVVRAEDRAIRIPARSPAQ